MSAGLSNGANLARRDVVRTTFCYALAGKFVLAAICPAEAYALIWLAGNESKGGYAGQTLVIRAVLAGQCERVLVARQSALEAAH